MLIIGTASALFLPRRERSSRKDQHDSIVFPTTMFREIKSLIPNQHTSRGGAAPTLALCQIDNARM